ncbi:MAG: thioredoxin domain-containing protein [Phycisphaerales bacterium]|nr:MAG: thioredoxin domain-containing protein [Phycisphaerales bacterium]
MPLLLIILFAFGAAGISWMLAAYHISHGRQAVGMYDLMCGYRGSGCQAVLQSRYGYLRGTTIPVAVLGVAYFLALGLWYLIVGRPSRRGRWWQVIPMGLNLVGLISSVQFTWVMFAVVREVCLWCLTTHVLNLLILVLAFMLWPRRGGLAEPARPSLRLGVAGCLLMVGAFVIPVLVVNSMQWRVTVEAAKEYLNRYRDDPALMAFAYQRREAVEIPLRKDDPSWGPAEAPHTVVVFSDFRCSACARLARVLYGEVLPEFSNQLRVVFKHYPLDNECNPTAAWASSFNSCAAAEAAEAARAIHGDAGFWKMHEQLFENQDRLRDEPDFRTLADEVGLDGEGIARAVAEHTYRDRVVEDINVALRLKVAGTPVVFLDGRRMTEWHRPSMWRAILSPEREWKSEEAASRYDVLSR